MLLRVKRVEVDRRVDQRVEAKVPERVEKSRQVYEELKAEK
jgi:hypothetical protein